MNYKILTGRESSHTKEIANGLKVHKEAISELYKLQKAAKKDDIDLAVASGFRDFERQLHIWNAKASGDRPLRDRDEKLLDFKSANVQEVLEAILTWSALPGASRHHWGTEIDIFDAKIKSRNDLSLTHKECEDDFSKLYDWLDENLADFNFHRPYALDMGGVAMEPWHLSFTPLSKKFEQLYSIDILKKSVEESNMLLKEEVLGSIDRIYTNYILNVSPA